MLKPKFLHKKIDLTINREMKSLLKNINVNTVCENSLCPNISECFCDKTATFMILGKICTRNCKFCGVTKGDRGYIDKDESKRIVKAVEVLNLDYVVLTCVTRDDLPDAGVSHFISVIRDLREKFGKKIKIEILTSDLYTKDATENTLKQRVKLILKEGVDVFGHNIEMVKSLYPKLREVSDYNRSLNILRIIKELDKSILSKSSIMIGFGETQEELMKTFKDLKKVNCDILIIGQYLQPSRTHIPVKKYYTQEELDTLKKLALNTGIKSCISKSYARSSYKAKKIYKKHCQPSCL